MPRPVNADAAATKQRILDSALELFGTRGIEAVSLRELALDANVSSAMIHHCFGGKDGLRQAAIDTMYTQLSGLALELAQLLDPAVCSSPGEAFDRAVRFAFAFCRNHRAAVRLLMSEVMARGELDAERQSTTNGPFLKMIPARLAEILDQEAGALRLPLHSCVTLVARYALSSDQELMNLTAMESTEQALTVAEEHLRCSVRLLLRLPAN